MLTQLATIDKCVTANITKIATGTGMVRFFVLPQDRLVICRIVTLVACKSMLAVDLPFVSMYMFRVNKLLITQVTLDCFLVVPDQMASLRTGIYRIKRSKNQLIKYTIRFLNK